MTATISILLGLTIIALATFGAFNGGVSKKVSTIMGALGVILIVAGMSLGPRYDVWEQRMIGMASLAKAEQDRQIRVQEAQASLDSAKLTAQAEVERAKGVAEANEIIAEGLGGAEGYLRWRYIEMLEQTGSGEGDRTIIYIPTEAGLPILEAQRLPNPVKDVK